MASRTSALHSVPRDQLGYSANLPSSSSEPAQVIDTMSQLAGVDQEAAGAIPISKGKGKARDLGLECETPANGSSSRCTQPQDERHSSEADAAAVSSSRPRRLTGDTLGSFSLAPVFPMMSDEDDIEPIADSEEQSLGLHGSSCDRRGSSASGIDAPHQPRQAVVMQEGYFDRASEAQRNRQGSKDSMELPSSATSHKLSRSRPTHTRAKSSLASSNLYDFFGPSSVTSAATATTSVCSSPTQPVFDLKNRIMTAQIASTDEQLGSSSTRRTSADDEVRIGVSAETGQGRHESPVVSSSDAQPHGDDNSAASQQPRPSQDPPTYPEEALPGYEEAPAYTPSPEGDYSADTQRATRGFRAAAANRFLTSRLARRLHISDTRQRGAGQRAGLLTPDASHGQALLPRIPLPRSDSMPEIPGLGSRTVEVHAYAATNYMQGARMGPTSRSEWPQASSSRPSTSAGVSVRSSPRSIGPNSVAFQSVLAAFSVNRATGESLASRSSSRPGSTTGTYAGASGGLFTCGYASNRSGSSTPGKPSRSSKSRSISIRDLSDKLFNKDRRGGTAADGETASPTGQSPATDVAVEGAVAGTPAETATSPTPPSSDEEQAVEPRAPSPGLESCVQPGVERPSLMRAAYSTPYASVAIDAAESGWLFSPTRHRDPCHFDKLPRELVTLCFRTLIEVHVHEHKRHVEDGTWRGSVACSTKWVGAESAVRELLRLTRVSRAWREYILDGQLWQALEVSSFPAMSEACLLRIGHSAGPFVQRLDLCGMTDLSSQSLRALFPLKVQQEGNFVYGRSTPWTSLVELNLSGCTALTTASLARLLSILPTLKKLDLSSLPCVTDGICELVAVNALALEHLDISRCSEVTGMGLTALSMGVETELGAERHTASVFRVLRAAGIDTLSSGVLSIMGKQWPNLEELDLSYTSIEDAWFASLVSSEGDALCREDGYHIALSPRQAGMESEALVRRRVFPKLIKLKLNSCSRLTDGFGAHLAYALPALKVLELSYAGMNGSRIRDAGLLKLIPTVPELEKLDLEGATHITDSVLAALTPPALHAEAYGAAAPVEGAAAAYEAAKSRRLRRLQAQSTSSETVDSATMFDEAAVAALIPATGTHLTHLLLSSARHLSAEAITLLVQRCPKLTHLEVDDTRAGDAVAREFVHLARQRSLQDAYISLVDCRGLTRGTNQELATLDGGDAGCRPRSGRRGWAFRHFYYDDADASAIESFSIGIKATPARSGGVEQAELHGEGNSNGDSASRLPGPTSSTAALRAALGQDECNRDKVVLKNFYAWESVDARTKARRKMEAKAAKRNKQRISNVVAMALSLGGTSGTAGSGSATAAESGGAVRDGRPRAAGGDMMNAEYRARSARWSRILAPLGGESDDDEDEGDPRGCVIA